MPHFSGDKYHQIAKLVYKQLDKINKFIYKLSEKTEKLSDICKRIERRVLCKEFFEREIQYQKQYQRANNSYTHHKKEIR